MRILIDHGAPVSLPDGGYPQPVHRAIESADRKALTILLEPGARLSVKDSSGKTALQICHDKGLAALLRAHGAR